MSNQTNRESCYICGEPVGHLLETHHIVPRRYDGSDNAENLVDLCPSCHQAVEKIYDERFYDRLQTAFENDGSEDKAKTSEEMANHKLVVKAIVDLFGKEKIVLEEIEERLDTVTTKQEAREELDKLRAKGEVYEPQKGVLRTT